MKRRIFALVLAAMTVLCVSCASSDAMLDAGGAKYENAVDDIYYSSNADIATNDKAQSESIAFTPSKDAPAESERGGDTSTATNDALADRKIVRTLHLTAETKAFDAATATIEQLCASLGGYIENSSRSGGSIRYSSSVVARNANYTLRIPADKLDAFRAGMVGDINVVDESSKIDDITDQYFDVDARLSTLKIEEERLLVMLEQATELEYMLTLERRLSEVRYEIETYTGTLRRYDNRVAFSTVHLNLSEVIEYTEVVEAPKTFGEELGVAFRESWADFAANCRDFAVGFVYALPTLVVVAIILVAIIALLAWLIRRNNRNYARRMAERQRAQEEAKEEQK